MKHLDFLSTSPSLYLLKEKRGKNKLGGFFSIIFALVMISLSIYYFYVYLYGLEYNLIYYRDNWRTYSNKEQNELLKNPKSFIFGIIENDNNAKIVPILIDFYGVTRPPEKCKINPFPDLLTNDAYCFDLIFFDMNDLESGEGNISLLLYCVDNCTKSNGEPAEIELVIITPDLKIDHSKKNPLIQSEYYGIEHRIAIDTNMYVGINYKFTPILYNSAEILNTKKNSFINTYFSSYEEIKVSRKDNGFAFLRLNLNTDCDIYIREYRTLLDTLSKIGGLLAPFKLLFEVFVFFYSDLETNSEIAKNVFSKIKNYENKPVNKIQIDNSLHNIEIKKTNENDNKVIRKKFNINKGEQYFCSFFNCFRCCNFCKTHRTMRILNLCSDFIKTYLSAENIIFNMILFENYYKDNPIRFNENFYLNQIDKEIEIEKIIGEEKNEEDENEIKEEGVSLITLNSEKMT